MCLWVNREFPAFITRCSLTQKTSLNADENRIFLCVSFSYDLFITGWAKKRGTFYCPHLRQMLTDFQNSFTAQFSGQLAIR